VIVVLRLVAAAGAAVISVSLAGAPAIADETTTPTNWWTGVQAWDSGTVQRIVDGDTLIVRNDATGSDQRIRLLGINAPEIPTKKHPGQCGGLEAKAILDQTLPLGTRVRMLSSDPNARGKKARPQRVVLAYNPANDQYDQDIAWGMAERGYGVWFTIDREAAMSSLYREVIEQAQRERRGIWNPEGCGGLDQPNAQLGIRIHRTPSGAPVNDEWVLVRNEGAEPVDISGWTLRDSGNQGAYVFPGGSYLSPGDYRVVHTGKGQATKPNPRDVYAGNGYRLYPAADKTNALLGDGAYLLDRGGNYRFWREYPCVEDCLDDPLGGSIVVEDYSLGEKRGKARAQTQWFTLRNRAIVPICLDGYRIETGGQTYSFEPGTCLQPGQKWTMRVGKPTSKRAARIAARSAEPIVFWGLSKPVLWENGQIEILTDQDRRLAWNAWGNVAP
jgi:micrococcal nuclease